MTIIKGDDYKMKKYIIFILVVCLTVSCASGLLYPRTVFSFKPLGDIPPSSATERLLSKDKYPQEIKINFRRPGNKFETFLDMSIFVKKPYKNLTIKDLRYSWYGGEGSFLIDTMFKLPENVSEIASDPSDYYGRGGYYWALLGRPINKKLGTLFIDMQKVFKDRNTDDKFTLTIEIIYSFDNEPSRSVTYLYEVTPLEGSYTSPYMGL